MNREASQHAPYPAWGWIWGSSPTQSKGNYFPYPVSHGSHPNRNLQIGTNEIAGASPRGQGKTNGAGVRGGWICPVSTRPVPPPSQAGPSMGHPPPSSPCAHPPLFCPPQILRLVSLPVQIREAHRVGSSHPCTALPNSGVSTNMPCL